MLVRKTHDPLALVATPVLSLVEVQTERALHIAVRQRLRGEGNAQDSCQSSADVMGRVRVPDDAHHGRGTAEGLDSAFDPMDSGVLDAVLSEDSEDVGVGVAAGGLLSSVWDGRRSRARCSRRRQPCRYHQAWRSGQAAS